MVRPQAKPWSDLEILNHLYFFSSFNNIVSKTTNLSSPDFCVLKIKMR